jgi:hypothetical protein
MTGISKEKTVKTTCPYCGVGAGCWQLSEKTDRWELPVIRIIRPTTAGCAQRGQRWGKPCRWKTGCFIRKSAANGPIGTAH